jgi:hypothetical protein
MPATVVDRDTETVQLFDANNNSVSLSFLVIKELNKLIKPKKDYGAIKRRQKKSIQFVLSVQK